MRTVCVLLLCVGSVGFCGVGTIHVDPNGSGGFAAIQAAIDAASDGQTVVVADGRYRGDGNRDLDFKGKAITVRSLNGPQQCIIDAEGRIAPGGNYADADYHRAFVFHSGETVASVVEGFTVLGGVHASGAGFLCTNGSSPTIRGNVIRDNIVDYDWDGGAGIGVWDGAAPVIEDNVICNNFCDEGGGGGGIRCYDSGPVRILGNRVFDNKGSGPGGIDIAYGCNGVLIANNVIWGNDSWALGCWWSNAATVANNTIVGDTAFTSDGEMRNCIVWGGSLEIVRNDSLKTEPGKVTYCCIEGWQGGGEGNIHADPLFADAANADFHLKSQAGRWDGLSQTWVKDAVTSPCIDAGEPASPIQYEPFPNGGVVNLGAYGGTAEASKSWFGGPLCGTIVAGDINGDCRVDLADLAILARHWLEMN